MGMKFVWPAERLVNSEVAASVRQELAKRTDPDRIAKALRELKAGRAFAAVPNQATRRLHALLTDLPKLIVTQTERRRSRRFEHVFRRDQNEDPAREHYRQAAREFLRLLESRTARELLQDRPVLEQHAQLLYNQLSGTIDSYDDLLIETKTFNLLLKTLYPNQVGKEEVLDAHHIIEERTFEKFKEIWKLLGWESPGDMPCISLAKEYHRRSPKRLRSIEKLAQEVREGEGVSSLSRELIKAIDVSKIKTPEELIKAYQTFYAKEAIGKDVLPLLDRVLWELSRVRSQSAIVHGAKKLRR